MKRIFTILILSVIPHLISGQTILDILRLLPREHLEEIIIDSLIMNKQFYPTSNSEEEIVKYTLTDVNDTTGTLRIEMSFESGQRAFTIRELKRLRVNNNEFIVVYSLVTGAPMAFGQSELATYRLKDGQLARTKEALLPSNISLSDFVKPNTPDSVLAKYNGYSNHSYNLINSGDNVSYVLHENFDIYEINKSWLLGDKIEFIFDNGEFKRSRPFFIEE